MGIPSILRLSWNRTILLFQDIKHCCFNLQSTLYKRYIKYFLENEDDHLDISQLKTNWQIENSWVKKGTQEGDNK
ncbi:unnamed protein product [Cylicostephanus goldi]|uniref:Uncharacterized protein n=1 Tax=Cylicostephanus goldi TaxID=71465 RepID=A0A3P6RHT0_CYLGO|nr:unnamed protein product [Cylicostephanus goldi]